MNRREFLKSAFAVAALAPVTRLAAKAGADGDKTSDILQGRMITRRRYKKHRTDVAVAGIRLYAAAAVVAGQTGN